jgi:adenylyltransferase/sulfurtransferase
VNLPPLVEPGPTLSRHELERYSRHVLLPQVGVIGQRRLAAARVLVIGAGGLGSPVLTYLAAAGAGTIAIADHDVVDLSNLQRQIVHGHDDVGQRKVVSAARTLAQINPFVQVMPIDERITEANALDLLTGYDLVVDGTDTFATRYLISDACAVLRVPCVWGSVYRFDGQVSVFWSAPPPPARPVTYRDLHPSPPPPGSVPSCAEGGVLGVVCAAIGAAMANEAVKLICGIGDPLLGRVMLFDALSGSWDTLAVRRAPGTAEVTGLAEDYEAFCGLQAVEASAIGVQELATWLAERDRGERDFVLIDVREPFEQEIARVPGALLIPLGHLQADVRGCLKQADAEQRPVVLFCKSGTRSAQALKALRDSGFGQAVHLEGGVLAWISQIDSSQPRY